MKIVDNYTLHEGSSYKTSDFIVDTLEQWWECLTPQEQQECNLVQLKVDNGPESSGVRTQFLKRMVDFVDATGTPVQLLYYPPYHSKYNPIERCWGILEQHWNGAKLTDVETMLDWAQSMTWKGLNPVINFSKKVYQKGISLSKKVMNTIEKRLERNPGVAEMGHSNSTSLAGTFFLGNHPSIKLMLFSTQALVKCPVCSKPTHRIHSRYERTLTDLPWADYNITLQLRVRKFFCINTLCKRRIFTERLASVTVPWARRTLRLAQRLTDIGLALGGAAGVRLSQKLGFTASRNTLLSLVRRIPLPSVGKLSTLGVDDFCFRKGQTRRHNCG